MRMKHFFIILILFMSFGFVNAGVEDPSDPKEFVCYVGEIDVKKPGGIRPLHQPLYSPLPIQDPNDPWSMRKPPGDDINDLCSMKKPPGTHPRKIFINSRAYLKPGYPKPQPRYPECEKEKFKDIKSLPDIRFIFNDIRPLPDIKRIMKSDWIKEIPKDPLTNKGKDPLKNIRYDSY